MEITGHTRLMALIGSPVAHSGSPAMYNYCFEKMGIDCVYVALNVPKEKTADAVNAMRLFNMRGGNVTMPCKQAALECMDELSPAAKITGAVNTIVNDDGVFKGYTTDGEGFVNNLLDNGVDIKAKTITVAGGGGAAASIYTQCALSKASRVNIFNRKSATYDNILKTVEKLKEYAPDADIRVGDIEDEDLYYQSILDSDIFANATTVGMKPNDNECIIRDCSVITDKLTVCDAVYNPLETLLLREGRSRGAKCIDGKGMLLWQGVSAFKLFTGLDMPVEEVKELYF